MFISAREEFEMRQADALANAWAVLENSLANMRSPAEVNSTSGRIVEVVSTTRSIESEGPRRIPSPRGEENGRRLSGNALVDAASVPLVYPPTELGRQGIPCELGGSGMIPGGMPSGVPPSVYLTPVDAQNQQYISRRMTMIPEGMPTGVPASVYHTPMDALNHQQVNRDIMSSVYGNAIQCSPELFTPAESAYYTAPNTCPRVQPLNWSTEATPGNSQSPNGLSLSQDGTEADSGIERSGSGRSLSNSRSQREELGNGQSTMSRSALRLAETGSKKSVRYASLDDDGQVILFVSSDSDVPDESENRPVKGSQSRVKREMNSQLQEKVLIRQRQLASQVEKKQRAQKSVLVGLVLVQPVGNGTVHDQVAGDVGLRARVLPAPRLVSGAHQAAKREKMIRRKVLRNPHC